MITIKCKYENGQSFTTRLNATIEEARDYYVGNVFNIGQVNDNMQKCVSVEEIVTDWFYPC